MANYTHQTYQVVEIPVPKHEPYQLHWQEVGNVFYAETPNGRVEIEETREHQRFLSGGVRIRHKVRIIHHTGVILDKHPLLGFADFLDFVDAERALQKQLARLDDPTIHFNTLPCMDFTLEICQRLLSESTDPIHYARLGMLASRISLALG